MNNFRKLILIIAVGSIISCKNQDKEVISRIEKIETEMKSQIDSLKFQLKQKQTQIDSLSNSVKKTKTTENFSELEIPFFIGKSKKFIRDFWSTKISIEYFDEGIYDDTKEEYFSIMVGSVGMPEFAASFKNGICNEHSTKIYRKDISIMQARLMQAGYKYDESCKCWKLPLVNHIWTINGPYGYDYNIKCTKKNK